MRAPVGGAQQQRGGAARLACSGRKGTVAAVPSSAISSSDRSKSSLSLMANSAVCGGTDADASRSRARARSQRSIQTSQNSEELKRCRRQHSTIRSRSCSRHSPQPRNRTPPEQHDEQRRGRQERGLEGRPEHRQHQGPRTGAMTSPCRLDLACEPRLGRRRQPALARHRACATTRPHSTHTSPKHEEPDEQRRGSQKCGCC